MSIPIGKPVNFLLLVGDKNPNPSTSYSLSIPNACFSYHDLLGTRDKNEFYRAGHYANLDVYSYCPRLDNQEED